MYGQCLPEYWLRSPFVAYHISQEPSQTSHDTPNCFLFCQGICRVQSGGKILRIKVYCYGWAYSCFLRQNISKLYFPQQSSFTHQLDSKLGP